MITKMDNEHAKYITFDESAKLTQIMMKCVGLPLEAFTIGLYEKGWFKFSQTLLFITSYMLLFLSVLGKLSAFIFLICFED